MIKLRDSELENWRLLKDINQFIEMDKTSLIKYIEKDLNHSVRADSLLDVITAFARDINNLIRRITNRKSKRPPYPPLDLNNSWTEYYIEDFQRVLCEDGWLCARCSDIKHLSLEEQIDNLSQVIWRHSALQSYRRRVSSLAIAALILKMGSKEFCGCNDSLPSKSPEDE